MARLLPEEIYLVKRPGDHVRGAAEYAYQVYDSIDKVPDGTAIGVYHFVKEGTIAVKREFINKA